MGFFLGSKTVYSNSSLCLAQSIFPPPSLFLIFIPIFQHSSHGSVQASPRGAGGGGWRDLGLRVPPQD